MKRFLTSIKRFFFRKRKGVGVMNFIEGGIPKKRQARIIDMSPDVDLGN